MSNDFSKDATPNFPSCTIIIPTRDKLELLEPCVRSVLASPYQGDLELLIVDNGSTDPETLAYLSNIVADSRVRVIHWQKPFNYSEINNMAASQARGEVLCFLNNDIKVKSPDWLQRLVPVANLADVGAVGALLLYPDLTIQHAGIALDHVCVGLHVAQGKELAELEQHYLLDHWYSVEGVTAACMFTKKSLFLKCSGFDEKDLPVSFNDLDYCLRLRELLMPCLINPSIQLFHFESQTRKSDDLPENKPRAVKERQYMLNRWHDLLNDAIYSGQMTWHKAGSEQPAPTVELIEQQARDLRHSLATPRLTTKLYDPSTSLEDRYRMLEIEYQSLESHAIALQRELELITRSRFWRLTAPLRRILSALIRLKQRAGLALVSTKFGRQLYNLKQPTPRQHEVAVPPAENNINRVKQEYSDSAKRRFERFLTDADKLDLPNSEQPAISIILVLFNQAPLTLLCLESLKEHADVPVEIIIVDNNSTDLTSEMLELISGAQLIRNTDNVGFVEAVNQGAAVAKGEYLLLLNNDAMLQSGSLQAALRVFKQEDNVGAVGGRIRLLDGTLQEAGSIIWQDGSCLGYGRGKLPESPEFAFRRDVDYCSGAFLMTPRALFDQLDRFDLDYAPAYYEESDYCIRLKKAGYRVVYEAAAEIIHYEFASSGGYEGASRLQLEHREILCQKHADFLAGQYPAAPDNILKARTSSRSKNILLIDDRVPHTSLGAGYPRSREILQEMAHLGLNITLYPILPCEEDWQTVYQTLPANVEVMLNSGKDRLSEFLTERQGFYDVIIVSRSINMECFTRVINGQPALASGSRIIYDAEALIAPREAARLRLKGKLVSDQQEKQMIDAELALAKNADCVLAVSGAEAAVYRDAGVKQVLILGHKAIANPTPRPYQERKDILFVGALRDDNSPNVDSLLWFIDEIWPRLCLELGPELELLIVGDNSAPSLKSITKKGIRFLGRQNDLEVLYDRCRLFVAPTRFAAGIPHKIHEAAAYGIPVVATPLLASQLSWQHERELLTGETPGEFAEQCVRLYRDGELWQQLRDNALLSLARDCSPESFRQTLIEITGAT